ncbi:MFS transporter [Streptomonospora sp. PA3]|uniref:MFS transporter n=1 Tax=Streptomonospora sp. PA3 TaxID=2607326 RepID=UPI0016430289|nr:MFS transporter [Streptomonospora sp. PA3]
MSLLDRARRLALPSAAITAGIVVNATFTGMMGVLLPLLLAQRGVEKENIALFFVVNALTAACLNLVVGRWLRKADAPRQGIAASSLLAAAGLAVLAAPLPEWTIYPAGMAVMCMSLVFPQYVAIADSAKTGSSARTMGTVRTLFVSGYVLGLGVYSAAALLAEVEPTLRPVHTAMAIAALNALLCLVPHRKPPVPEPAQADGESGGHSSRPNPLRVIAVAIAVVLMLRAADSLRQVYLPLYALATDVPEPAISALFAVTTIVELVVLVPLGIISERFGSVRTLIAVCAFGAVSFTAVVLFGGLPALFGSQVVYAVFTAGFQSIAVVLLGDVLRSGISGGAGVYTAVVQAGSMIGFVAPLMVPGYQAEVFWIGVALCVAPAVLLALLPRLGFTGPAKAEEARVPGSGRAQ